MVCEVAKRLGYEKAFDFPNAAAIFREHAALSGFENSGTRDFDVSDYQSLTDDDYRHLKPFYWPAAGTRQGGRFFADGRFFTPNGKGRFIPTPLSLPLAVNPDFPVTLNTGRIRDQWHTMTRTGYAPRLTDHISEPFLEVHPDLAARYGLRDGYLVKVTSRYGALLVKAQITPETPVDAVFLPMHFCAPFAKFRADALVNPDCDPVSGQPGLKQTPVHIEPIEMPHYGFVLTREPWPQTALDQLDYWVQRPANGYWHLEFATQQPLDAAQFLAHSAWPEMLHSMMTVLSYEDVTQNDLRYAVMLGESLQFVLYRNKKPISLEKTWLGERFHGPLNPIQRRALLNGGLTAGLVDQGRLICACHQVYSHSLVEAIKQGHRTVEDLGLRLKAGTGCGSCVPELRALLKLHN